MATLRDPANITPVVDSQVLVSFADDPKIGKDGHFGEEWETVGILAEGSKLELNRVIEKNKVKGWGFGVVAVSTKPGELTAKASVLERNGTVDRIAWPDKSDKGILFHSEKVAMVHVALVSVNQRGKMEVTATRHKAIATIEDLGFGEDPEGKDINFDFQPGKHKDVFDRIMIDAPEAAAVDLDVLRFDDSANSDANQGKKLRGIKLPKATGGTFTVTVDGQTTSALAHDVDATAFKEALEALSSVTLAEVSGDAAKGFKLALTVPGEGKISADGSTLTGGTSTKITIANP